METKKKEEVKEREREISASKVIHAISYHLLNESKKNILY